jgi:hypothetical protein
MAIGCCWRFCCPACLPMSELADDEGWSRKGDSRGRDCDRADR